MGLVMKAQQQAVIRWCERRQLFGVHIGITIPYYGQLYACELFCKQNGITIRNRDEINRIKTGNMPVWEGIA